MSERVRFTGQASEVVEVRRSIFETLNDDPLGTRELIKKYMEAQADNGEYRIPRQKLIDADLVELEEIDRRLQEIAAERGLDVSVHTDFDTDETVVRWRKP